MICRYLDVTFVIDVVGHIEGNSQQDATKHNKENGHSPYNPGNSSPPNFRGVDPFRRRGTLGGGGTGLLKQGIR